MTSDSRHHITSFRNIRTEKKRFIATWSKYYSLILSDVIGSSVWGEVTFNYNVYKENWDVPGSLEQRGEHVTWESYRVEGNSLSPFIRAVAKSKNILSNLSQQLCFMFALMFHIRGIAIRQLFSAFKGSWCV